MTHTELERAQRFAASHGHESRIVSGCLVVSVWAGREGQWERFDSVCRTRAEVRAALGY